MGRSRHRSASIRTGTDLEYCRAKELKAFIKAARKRAAPVGPGHALWDLIFDAEALLVGGQTLLSREQIEHQIRSMPALWID